MDNRASKFNPQKTFFIADTHFFDNEIIKTCDRPFKNSDDMNKYIINQWNAVISNTDSVFMLGDIYCNGNDADSMKKLIGSLNGTKFLVMGNHDTLSITEYQKVFSGVYPFPIILNEFFILSHEPNGFHPISNSYVNIYGHVHNDTRYSDFTVNSCCVSAERIDYTPISLERIKDNIAKIRNN